MVSFIVSTGTEWRECPGVELALLCQRGLSGGTSAGEPYEAMATSSALWGSEQCWRPKYI